MHSAGSTGKNISGSTRTHIISRLAKADRVATRLCSLLQDHHVGACAQDVFEACAYYFLMSGALSFEKQSWESCVRVYSEAHLIYTALAKSIDPKRDDLYREILSSTVDPSVRYAAYQLRLPRTLSIDTIVARYVSKESPYLQKLLQIDPDLLSEDNINGQKKSGNETEDLPKTITWRSRTVKLEDAAIAQALASVSIAEQRLSALLSSERGMDGKDKASAYDDVLLPSQDAVDATKTVIDELATDGVSQGDQRMQSLQITRTAVSYALVGHRVGRNRMLFGKEDGAYLEAEKSKRFRKGENDSKQQVAKKESNGRKLTRLRERVVLYDATLQSIDSVGELPGVAADQTFRQELDAKRSYFASLRLVANYSDFHTSNRTRCLNVARSHALLGNKKNALALYARALSLSSQVLSSRLSNEPADKPPSLDVSVSQAKSLQQLLQSLVSHHRALVELEGLDSSEKEGADRKSWGVPLIERLDDYPHTGVDLGNLVTYPPRLEPVAVKPLFFDIAWNYIEYPGRVKKAAETAVNGGIDSKGNVEEKKESRRGWFGFGR